MTEFSEKIYELRTEKGQKQSDIAVAIGVSVQSYSAYENGREPNYDLLCKIANYFDVSIDYLLGMDMYVNKNIKDIANSVSNGHLNELAFVAERDAAKIYKELLECIIEHQQYYDSIYENEYKVEPCIVVDLLYELSDTIAAYKMIMVYLKQNKSYLDTIYKFREMIGKADYYIKTVSELAMYYNISDEPKTITPNGWKSK
jgi:transcriptional regulator with XRE-family HTH domain